MCLYLLLSLAGDVHEMPVPASYNDITTNSSIRDYVGWAWYSTQFYVDPGWQEDSRVVLRFGSVHYTAMVYLNGEFVTEHSGGHLPFQAEIYPGLVLIGQLSLLLRSYWSRAHSDEIFSPDLSFMS